MTPTSLYIHLPFCASKCAYCDFNSIVAPERLRENYYAALLREISRCGRRYHERLFTTVYFGGGTPTLYNPGALCQLLATIRHAYHLTLDAEISLEANPGTVTAEGLSFLRDTGFNRLSLGIQSLDARELRLLGRGHSAQQAREAVAAARAAGFGNLSVDLINCLPGQSADSWRRTLDEVVFWLPEHISCYGLSLEPGTELGRQAERGVLQPSEEGAATEIYELTHRTLTAAGYEHYEVSNFARQGSGPSAASPFRCRHNETYWRNGEYVGIGAGATSYLNGHRIKSDTDPHTWTDRVLAGLQPELVQREAVDDRQRAVEVLMLALRTSEGLDLRAYCREFGLNPERFELRVRALVEAGLAEYERERLILTPVQGFLLHSEIVQMFM